MKNWMIVLLVSVFPLSVLGQDSQPSPVTSETFQKLLFAGPRELTPVNEFEFTGPTQPCGKYFYGVQEDDEQGIGYVYTIGDLGLGSKQNIQNVWVYLDESKKRPTAEHVRKDNGLLVEVRISSEDYKLATCLPPTKEKKEVSGPVVTD